MESKVPVKQREEAHLIIKEVLLYYWDLISRKVFL